MKKVTNQEMQEIFNFIRQSVYEFKELNFNGEEIIIALPNWLICFFQHYPMYEYRGFDVPVEQFNEYLFFGIKTQPHYTDEIVVFYKDFHYCPDKDTYKIHLIKFTND